MGRRSQDVMRWILIGALIGATLVSIPFLPELSRRVVNDLRDVGGEAQDWGEPLFSLVVFAVPAGTVGAIAGAIAGALGVIASRIVRR